LTKRGQWKDSISTEPSQESENLEEVFTITKRRAFMSEATGAMFSGHKTRGRVLVGCAVVHSSQTARLGKLTLAAITSTPVLEEVRINAFP
jgi:hypothetical protein